MTKRRLKEKPKKANQPHSKRFKGKASQSNPNQRSLKGKSKNKFLSKAKVIQKVEEDVKMNIEYDEDVQISDYLPNKAEPSNINETVIEKQGAIVDKYIPDSLDYHVVPDIDKLFNGKAFECTLNYSNIAHNNNKFYIIQLIQEDNSENYYIFLRWGRVGRKGQTNMIEMGSLNDGIEFFLSKYEGKREYGYEEVNLDFSSSKTAKAPLNLSNDPHSEQSAQLNSKEKDQQVVELIRLIYNINIINDQMKEIGYDSSRLPLGKISNDTITEGYLLLQEIEMAIGQGNRKECQRISSRFFTRIPHNFDFQPLSEYEINTMEKLTSELKLLESIKDITTATKIINEGSIELDKEQSQEGKETIESIYYKQLNCSIKPIDINSVPLVTQYFNASLAVDSHSTIAILEAFELNKETQSAAFDNSIENIKLLWYGTRITNYISLLQKGFRIAPPEAPPSSFPFGKGIYFSDMSVKAACSCYPSNDIGLLLLCEVALGKSHEIAKTESTLPQGLPQDINSVKACGREIPDKESDVIENSVTIPIGKPIKSKLETWLGFNQYIVYNTNQIKFKYLLKVQFSKKFN